MELADKESVGGLLSKNDHLFGEVVAARKGKALVRLTQDVRWENIKGNRGKISIIPKQDCKIKSPETGQSLKMGEENQFVLPGI